MLFSGIPVLRAESETTKREKDFISFARSFFLAGSGELGAVNRFFIPSLVKPKKT